MRKAAEKPTRSSALCTAHTLSGLSSARDSYRTQRMSCTSGQWPSRISSRSYTAWDATGIVSNTGPISISAGKMNSSGSGRGTGRAYAPPRLCRRSPEARNAEGRNPCKHWIPDISYSRINNKKLRRWPCTTIPSQAVSLPELIQKRRAADGKPGGNHAQKPLSSWWISAVCLDKTRVQLWRTRTIRDNHT